MLTKKIIESYRNSQAIDKRIIVTLADNGGILPFELLVKKMGINNLRLLRHHIRENYYLDRIIDGDIIKLCPRGKEEKRLFTNPFLAPDVSGFIMSLVYLNPDLTHIQACSMIAAFLTSKEINPANSQWIRSDDGFYNLKKKINNYRKARGEI
jgi:hypothetical protein